MSNSEIHVSAFFSTGTYKPRLQEATYAIDTATLVSIESPSSTRELKRKINLKKPFRNGRLCSCNANL